MRVYRDSLLKGPFYQGRSPLLCPMIVNGTTVSVAKTKNTETASLFFYQLTYPFISTLNVSPSPVWYPFQNVNFYSSLLLLLQSQLPSSPAKIPSSDFLFSHSSQCNLKFQIRSCHIFFQLFSPQARRCYVQIFTCLAHSLYLKSQR